MVKLNDYLTQNTISMTGFARSVGTTTATISRVIGGSVVPRKLLMLEIYEKTEGQVTPNDLVGLHYADGQCACAQSCLPPSTKRPANQGNIN